MTILQTLHTSSFICGYIFKNTWKMQPHFVLMERETLQMTHHHRYGCFPSYKLHSLKTMKSSNKSFSIRRNKSSLLHCTQLEVSLGILTLPVFVLQEFCLNKTCKESAYAHLYLTTFCVALKIAWMLWIGEVMQIENTVFLLLEPMVFLSKSQ